MLQESREEASFQQIFQSINVFCQENNITLAPNPAGRRKRLVSSRITDFIVESTTGQRERNQTEEFYRTRIYYPLIDNMLVEMKERFSSMNLQILSGISSLSPDSDSFLFYDSIKPIADHLNYNLSALRNELSVIKSMLESKSLASILDLYRELHPYQSAFPVFFSILRYAITIPVSSTTCERTFSKMKRIKTSVRNTMMDERLNDLCLLAVERDVKIDFEQLMDDFSTIHRNSRILLK